MQSISILMLPVKMPFDCPESSSRRFVLNERFAKKTRGIIGKKKPGEAHYSTLLRCVQVPDNQLNVDSTNTISNSVLILVVKRHGSCWIVLTSTI